MKRWFFFFAVLVVMFVVSFALSLWMFPGWPTRPGWFMQLTVAIVIAGLSLLGGEVFSKALSFLFEDRDFKERLLFIFGDKYSNIAKRLHEFTQQEIAKEKKSKKYIPNIFVETTEIKEKLRYFSEPFIFFPKIAEQLDRSMWTAYIINILKEVHYPVDDPVCPSLSLKTGDQKSLAENIQRYQTYLDQKLDLTNILIKEKGAGIRPEYISKIPPEFSHIHSYMYHNLQYYRLYEHDIESAKEDLVLLKAYAVIVKSLAGHGKTNLLCDFAENFLLRKGHSCLYISARSLNHLGEQETIEQAIVRTIFADSDFQFSDILRLIKFSKKKDALFILVDGINEHKNLPLFASALEQFIQRCGGREIKLIFTCRSEYFDERFGNLLQIDNCSVLNIDEWKYVNKVPDVHIEALLSRYFSEFKVDLSPDDIDPDIMKVFNEDKLLLRIFCEAYENERPAEYLDDLYKLEIFNKYYEKKTQAIQGLESCLTEIVNKMIADNQFANTRISDLSAGAAKVVENTVYENVIIKKDMLVDPDLAFARTEVINFVYDEFRDFLLASKVILAWDQNNQLSINLIQSLTAPTSPVAEGLQRYLCLWAIKNKKNNLLGYLSVQNWFARVFIDSVFDTPDSLLSNFVINLIGSLFRTNPTNALRLIWPLARRTNTVAYPRLNIESMFNWLNAFDEAEYERIVVGALGEDYYYDASHISELCHQIIQAFSENGMSEASSKNLIRLLAYFVRVKDYKYLRRQKYDLGEYPAFQSILELSRLVDSQLLLEQIAYVIANIYVEYVKSDLQILLEILGGK